MRWTEELAGQGGRRVSQEVSPRRDCRAVLAARRHLGWRAVPRELAIVLAGVLVYFGVRGMTEGSVGLATRNAAWILDLERSLGIDVEAQVQAPFSASAALTTVANWVYIWGHWPVIAATLLWLVLRHPAEYVRTRNALLVSGAVGMVVFALFPVTPPRLLDIGLVDTVTEYSRSYRVLQPPAFVNQYAAMPSLHTGWDLLMAMGMAATLGRLWQRTLMWLMPALMFVAVVATANHYVLDPVGGILLVVVSRWVVARRPWRRLQVRVARRRAAVAAAGRPARRGGLPG